MSPFKRHKKSICVKSKTKYTSSKKLAKQQKLPIGKKKKSSPTNTQNIFFPYLEANTCIKKIKIKIKNLSI